MQGTWETRSRNEKLEPSFSFCVEIYAIVAGLFTPERPIILAVTDETKQQICKQTVTSASGLFWFLCTEFASLGCIDQYVVKK